MMGTRMGAGDKGVQPFDLVGKPVGDGEFQRAVGDGRLRPEARITQPVKHLVGPECAMFLQQDFKCLAPDRREPEALICANGLGRGDGRVDAMGMVMRLETDRIGRDVIPCAGTTYYVITFPVLNM